MKKFMFGMNGIIRSKMLLLSFAFLFMGGITQMNAQLMDDALFNDNVPSYTATVGVSAAAAKSALPTLQLEGKKEAKLYKLATPNSNEATLHFYKMKMFGNIAMYLKQGKTFEDAVQISLNGIHNGIFRKGDTAISMSDLEDSLEQLLN